jgi:hypothetical protein
VNSRRHSRRMPQRMLAMMAVLALAGCSGGQDGAGSDGPDAVKEPNQTSSSASHDAEPNATGIFADIHGWIVYGGDDGIWAVDPSGPADQEPKLVTDRPRQPLGWSSDGGKLLIERPDGGLVVLNADGTENQVVSQKDGRGASISLDGTQVVYADDAGIYTVGTDGGTPALLHAPKPEADPEPGDGPVTVFDRETYFPVFSPDGRQIAFFDGHGDWGHRLRVMNADGTGSRTLDQQQDHIYGLAWSLDGQRLVFSNDGGTWVVGIDGSGPTQVVGRVNRFGLPVRGGTYPTWSPEGSRIAYLLARLCTAQADGTQEACFTNARPSVSVQLPVPGLQWNPLPLEGGAE